MPKSRPVLLRVVGLTAAVLCVAATTLTPSPALAANEPVSTLFATNAVPTVPAFNDASAAEVGVRFKSAVNGTVTGLRFYQGPGNTGTHSGSLWTSSGTQLATLTFGDSSGTGWRMANFTTPVPVIAGMTYVASYLAPNGHYAADPNFFTAPLTNGPLTAPATNNGVFRYGGSGFPTSSYSATNYWVDPLFVAGGAQSSTFSLFADGDTPTTANWDDSTSNELGLKFSSDVSGVVTALRFYKGSNNTGTHTGSMWTSEGRLLATATFSGETGAGWQTVTFTPPVAITADTTYVASYHTSTGFYSVNLNGFAGTGLDSGPLHVPAAGGAYHVGAGFPGSRSNHNYWVDIVFKPNQVPSPETSPSTPSPTTPAVVPAPPATTSAPSPTAAANGVAGGDALPITGTNVGIIAGCGLLLAGIGTVLFVAYRRRNSVRFTA
ncbi:MAG: hypothetical protein JWP76_329 [Dactylosporangium sp.]|jgi:hypothetical protein|nr:hypothetical protein [Dactylosporangium sp.]